MLNPSELAELRRLATQIRIQTVRQIGMLGVGHIGGTMSVAELMAVLYGKVLKIDPKNPKWEDRDYFVVSKGHCGPAVYASLALKGYFPMDWLDTLNKNGTNLPSHTDRLKTPGVDMTTGSLGQGGSQAAGVALAFKMDNKENYTYTLFGDGECCEGQVWEFALFANQFKLTKLIAFIDYNKQMLDDYTEKENDIGDVAKKFEDFGWYAQNIDGHDVGAIYDAIENAKAQDKAPSMIVLNTVKGKGISWAEGLPGNHNMPVSREQMEETMAELEKVLESIQ
jgi:transketolase